MRKLIHIFLLLLFTSGLAAQDTNLSGGLKGKVTDIRKEPLIGVNVKDADGKVLAVSDLDGLFTINKFIQPGEVLTISYLGYRSQNIKVDGKTELNIILDEDAQKLDEIVVIGYGTQKRSSLTSSIETVTGEDLLRIPTANIDQALVGQAAGLSVMSATGDPGSAREATLSIRGVYGSPLLVIDGIPRFAENTSDGDTRLSDLNPDDIESISILKDAAAAAVYGVRAAKGVVLVTTKRGKGDKKIRVNYRGQFNLQEATEYPKFLNSYEFAKLYNRAIDNSPEVSGKTYYTPEQLEDIRTNARPDLYGNENLIDYLKDYGYSTTHSVGVTGGNEQITYYISGGYTNTKGLYSGVGRDRYNYSVKLDVNLVKGLDLSVDVLGSRSDYKNTSYQTIDAAYNYSPIQLLRFPDGRLTSIDSSNPLIAVDGLGGFTETNSNITTISTNLKYQLPWVKGLSAYFKATFDTNNSTTKTYSNPVTLYRKDPDTGEIVEDEKTVYPNAKISVQDSDQDVDNKLFELGVNYNHTFAAKHNVTGLILVNYQKNKNRTLSSTYSNLPGPYPPEIGSGAVSDIVSSGNRVYTERASMVGRITYGYGSRYFIEGNFRVDGSTRFHPDNRWGFFPSLSASWVTSNEDFFKNWKQEIVSNIKFRASMGILGDDGAVSNFSYLMSYGYPIRQGYNIGGILRPGVVMSSQEIPNPNISWEKRRDYNIAADLGFWDNRFGITYEYYWRYNTDMLTQVPSYLYPPSTGIEGRLPYMNFGKVKNWGWDLTISHKNAIDKVKYNIDVTLSKVDNEILDYGDESALSATPNLQRKGKSSLTWQLYEADGLFQSYEEIQNHPIDQDGQGNITLAPGDIKYKDHTNDNKITEDDRIYVKNSGYPEMSYSIKLGASYKGFFFNAMFQGVNGYQQQINEIYSLEAGSLQRFQAYHRDNTWTEDNPNAKYPRIKFASRSDNNRKASTLWVQDCDFLRLKALTIGYTMPAHIVKKLRASSMTVSLQGSNLFTWSSLDGMDPESLRGYPIQRSYGATLSVGF